jgi:hypothetical protein
MKGGRSMIVDRSIDRSSTILFQGIAGGRHHTHTHTHTHAHHVKHGALIGSLSRHHQVANTGRRSHFARHETVVIGPNSLWMAIVTPQQLHCTFGRLEYNDPITITCKGRCCRLGENHCCSSTTNCKQTPVVCSTARLQVQSMGRPGCNPENRVGFQLLDQM